MIRNALRSLMLVVCIQPALASAQTEAELASRRVMLEQAQAARASGDHQRALELATNAARVQVTPSLRMFIAREQAALGDYAEAFGSADQCIRDVQRDVNAPDRGSIQHECERVLATARANVGFVVVHAPTPAPDGLAVRVNGSPLSATLYGSPYVVRAGHVTVDASATALTALHRELDVTAGATGDVELRFEAAAPLAANSAVPASESPAPAMPAAQPSRGSLVPAVLAFGLGVIGFGVAGGAFAAQQGVLGDTTQCVPESAGGYMCHQSAATAASNWNTTAIVSASVGGAAIVLGAVLTAIALGGSHHDARVAIVPSDRGATLVIGGAL